MKCGSITISDKIHYPCGGKFKLNPHLTLYCKKIPRWELKAKHAVYRKSSKYPG
jgi:lipopolysaccharide export system protein LptC